MYRITDTKTKKTIDVDIDHKKLAAIRSLNPVAYLAYGVSIGLLAYAVSIPVYTTLIILVLAYSVNIPLSLSQRFYAPVEYIHSYLAYPIMESMLTEPINTSKCEILRLFMRIYYCEEDRLFRKIIKGGNE